MSDQPKVPRAPKGLKTAGRRLWQEMHAAFDFKNDPHRTIILEAACRTADDVKRFEQASADIDTRVKGSQGQPVSAPEFADVRHYRRLLASLLKDLAVPDTTLVAVQKYEHAQSVERFIRPS